MARASHDSTFQVVDLLRTVAILPVLASHSVATFSSSMGGVSPIWRELCRNNLYGVTIFFVVSGFLITRVLSRGPGGLGCPDLRHFYVRRFGRIVPLAFLFVVIGALFLWFGHSIGAHIQDRFHRPWIWLSLATFTFNWYEIVVNVPWFGLHWMVFWSLAVEEQFYVFYPVVLRLLGSPRRIAAFLALMLVTGPTFRLWACWTHPENYWLESIATFSAVDALAVGALLYMAWERTREDLWKRPLISALLMGLGGAMGFLVFVTTSIYDTGDLVWAPTLLAAGCFFILLGGLSLPWFEAPWLRVFALPGKVSYGNYLLHTTVLFFVGPYLASLTPGWGFPLFVLAATMVALASFYLYEQPLNRWIRHRWDRG